MRALLNHLPAISARALICQDISRTYHFESDHVPHVLIWVQNNSPCPVNRSDGQHVAISVWPELIRATSRGEHALQSSQPQLGVTDSASMTASELTVTNFNSLPREFRDLIYEQVLVSPSPIQFTNVLGPRVCDPDLLGPMVMLFAWAKNADEACEIFYQRNTLVHCEGYLHF